MADPGRQQMSSVGIVGLGLIGGSVAARVRQVWPAVRLVGVDRGDVAAHALDAALVDETRPDPAQLADCDLVVLEAPVPDIIDLIATLPPGAGPIVTDVGSTKREIMAAAAAAGLTNFVGGHPMAGAEHAGLEHASPDLFHGRPWVLVESAGAAEHRRLVEGFVNDLGATPVLMTADAHDRTMAYVSHLPQLLAVVLMTTAADACGREGLAAAGRGFHEMTRLAASPAALWQGILESNRDYVAEALRVICARLEVPAGEQAPDIGSLIRAFERANGQREDLLAAGDVPDATSGTQ